MPNFQLYNYNTVSSTNDKAKTFAEKGNFNLVVIAERQTKGRGRFNRKWSSSSGGLYMTILLKEKNSDKIKYLTLIASLAVSKSIKSLSGLNGMVKWPNDVLVNGKKVCGILTEILHGKKTYAIIGIGLNINQKKFPKIIMEKATSLKIECNKQFEVKTAAKFIIREFQRLYAYYEKHDCLKITNLWKKSSHTIGKWVKAKTLEGEYAGKAIGIDKDCNLLLKLDNGKIKKIMEGDIFITANTA
ncbi:biotin--[acetyl-CoA-carboxylase] ligase [Candidatus Woesearchaeota archaeon]|nr:biotin--[acetyl-CoA-carboxylase] ligase [Candidatus Woesearchaeota archaeon]